MNRHLAAALAVLGGLALIVGVPSASLGLTACERLPDETCFGHRLVVFDGDDAGRGEGCARCAQAGCCDEIGACQGDPACVESFRSAYRCVLDRGPAAASDCTSPLGPATSPPRRLYDCLRRSCGSAASREAACGISNCDVDRSVIQIGRASCDRCISGSCCSELNGCYRDRRCKLTVECIARECTGTLGSDMDLLAALGPEQVEVTRAAVCANAPVAFGGENDAGQPSDGGPGACLQRCLGDFAPVSGGTSDDANARCLAFSIFACSANARCGPACTEGALSGDAGRLP